MGQMLLQIGWWLALGSGAAMIGNGCSWAGEMSNPHDPVRAPGLVRVIAQLRIQAGLCDEKPTTEQCRQAISEMREELFRELEGTPHRVTRAYDTIPFVALEVSPEALRVLKESSRVRGVEEDTLSAPQRVPDANRPSRGLP